MDVRIRKKVDELKNCEDIAFNMLVSHMSRQPPLKVTTRFSFYCAECEHTAANSTDDSNETGSISMRRGHYEKRSQCLKYFVSIYGYNPLLYSQYRADSVLYKTKLAPDMQKCFKLIWWLYFCMFVIFFSRSFLKIIHHLLYFWNKIIIFFLDLNLKMSMWNLFFLI